MTEKFEKDQIYAVPYAGKIAFVKYYRECPYNTYSIEAFKANFAPETNTFDVSEELTLFTKIYASSFRKFADIESLALPYINWIRL